MIDNIVVGIVAGAAVLLIGGMGWLAYHHPEHYERAGMIAQVIIFSTMTSMCGYNNAIFDASLAAMKACPKCPSLTGMIFNQYWIWAPAPLILYLLFLQFFVTKWKPSNKRSQNRRRKKPPPQE